MKGQFALYRLERTGGKITPIRGPGGFTFQPTGDFKRKYIFAVSNIRGNNDIFKIPLAGGPAIAIDATAAQEIYPSFDPNKRLLYFVSQRDGDFAIYRIAF